MANEFKVENGVKFHDNTVQTTAGVSPTGTGASGTWGISVTGNAATATTVQPAAISEKTELTSGQVDSSDMLLVFDASDSTLKKATIANAALVGPTGPTGAAGAPGSNGTPGFPGQPGFDGLGFDNVTSFTSTTIGTGSKTFSVSSTGAYVIGTRVRVVNTGSSTNFMEGAITALSTNSSITVNVTNISGSGTLSAWTVTVAGLVGSTGPTGPQGATGQPGFPGQPGFNGLGFDNVTSFTSTTIGTGSKTFSVSSTGAYVIGTRVRVVNTGSSTNFMEGAITALSTNSSITVNVTNISGSGTLSAWTVTVAGLVGPTGPEGPEGPRGFPGQPSDDRLKTRLGNIENALERVRNLNGFFYEANETAAALGHPVLREVGVSAQELLNQLPEVVIPGEIGLEDEVYWAVHYERICALLIEAIKEQQEQIDVLNSIINKQA